VRQADYAKKMVCRILPLQQRKYPLCETAPNSNRKDQQMSDSKAKLSIVFSIVTMILIVVNFQVMG
jgi:hypothetical protein